MQVRTPEGERTRAMRQRLMEATIDCLAELGWAGTTTTEVPSEPEFRAVPNCTNVPAEYI